MSINWDEDFEATGNCGAPYNYESECNYQRNQRQECSATNLGPGYNNVSHLQCSIYKTIEMFLSIDLIRNVEGIHGILIQI